MERKMNTEIIHEMGETYIRMCCDDVKDPDANLYEIKMMTTNKISGLLPCSRRTIDGESFFYYCITGMQPLLKTDRGINLGWKEVLKLFLDIKDTYVEVQRFLMDGKKMIVEPEFIYQDTNSKKCFFFYYPGADGREAESFSALLETLMEKIDNQDDGAVECVYGAYEKALCENFSALDMIDFVCDYPVRMEQKEKERVSREQASKEQAMEREMEQPEINRIGFGKGTGEDAGDDAIEKRNYLGKDDENIESVFCMKSHVQLLTYSFCAVILFLIFGCILVFVNAGNYVFRIAGAAITALSFLMLTFFSIKLTPSRS